MDGGGNIWQKKDAASKLGSGPKRVAAAYIFGILACIVAGLGAPDLFISKTAVFASQDEVTSAANNYVFDISDYKKSHQSIYFSMRLNIPIQLRNAMELNAVTTYETEARYNVSVYGSPDPTSVSESCTAGCVSCPDGGEGFSCDLLSEEITGKSTIVCEEGEDWCSWLSLYSVNFVGHMTYYWVVNTDNDIDEYVESADVSTFDDWVSEFRVVFVSRWYTTFEMAWYYGWVFITLLVMFLPRRGFFTVAVSDGILWKKWSRLQKWAAVLLVWLFFFNNPFFAAQIYSPGPRSSFIWFALAEGILVSLLLQFWLDRLFDAGRAENERRGKGAAARTAGAMLVGLLCIVYVLNMINIRVSRDGNPDRVHKYPYTSTDTEQMLTVLCFVYCVWVMLLVLRAWLWGAGVREKLSSNRRVQLLVVCSFATMVLLIPAIIVEYLQPRVRGGVAFTLAHGSINLYVLGLALQCAPRHKAAAGKREKGFWDMEEEDDGSVRRTVNPMVLQKATNVGGEEESKQGEGNGGTGEKRSNSGWWRGKQRPKIQDSSVWEDDMQPEL